MPSEPDTEQSSLLPRSSATKQERLRSYLSPHRLVSIIIVVVYLVGTIVALVLHKNVRIWPTDPHEAALAILDRHPLIDTHIDLPILVRFAFKNNLSSVDLQSTMPAHVDIPRLRQGRVGGFFWSVYTDCPSDAESGPDFIGATNSVRDTLEQIDIARALISKYPETFSYAPTVGSFKSALSGGKIASVLGIEGGHQLGNSLAALRMFYELGVRYVTLTHACHNAFADSAGIFTALPPLHGGLSEFGRTLIKEMNRLGMIVDISHTSDDTARDVLRASKAPVIWSHSSARSVWNVVRNVPDDILEMIGTEEGKTDAVVQVNFSPYFVAAEGNATVEAVADHVDWIGRVAGKKHVGLGSDFDGIGAAPKGLEDVSVYPNLFAELYRRGWTSAELDGLAGDNFLRVYQGVEKIASQLKRENYPRREEIYSKRKDLDVEL